MVRNNRDGDQALASRGQGGGPMRGTARRQSWRNDRVMVPQELVPAVLPARCVARELKSIPNNGPENSPETRKCVS